ncbi:MAG: hypothetical protein JSW07_01575 [bacterium]|nr:MAG: hypothetical protein JSW07_01575 [bacterium]
MTVSEALKQVKKIEFSTKCRPVVKTVAEQLKNQLCKNADLSQVSEAGQAKKGVFRIFIADENFVEINNKKNFDDKDWMFFRIDETGGGELVTSVPHLLYGLFYRIEYEWIDDVVNEYKQGRSAPSTFKWQRSLMDIFFAHQYRTARHFNREAYVRECARLGYSHIEVNCLATPVPFEKGVPDEVYPHFYNYCAALDQFVDSRLNRGIYPADYLQGNLNLLKYNACLALKYGITPGLLCFEPRNVPDALLERYPMLRGARVDHPFRSLKPRYNLTLAHPAVREHYAEMMEKLMKQVPELGYISIWTNDSGAGFEYTSTLYVGRNGGAYLIREWKSNEEIADKAGENIMRFMKLLRDTARKVNPEFRVIGRLEALSSERHVIDREIGNGIDVEVATLLSKDFESPYHHPLYEDATEVLGTIFHNSYDVKEKKEMAELKQKDCWTHVVHGFGNVNNIDALLGTPAPWLTFDKLKAMAEVGAQYVASYGGINPPTMVPWSINHEVFRAFQMDSSLDIETIVNDVAKRWGGEKWAGDLVEAWRLTDQAIRVFPIPVSMYMVWGHTWMRLWLRPLVPNIEAIPKEDRAYYERFMISPPHNPANVDLMRDVLFELTTPDRCMLAVERMDQSMWTLIDKAMKIYMKVIGELREDDPAYKIFIDQSDRLRALKCWFRTHRNVAAWIAGVHGYLESQDEKIKAERRQLVRDMVLDEIANTRELLELWETSDVDFMVISEYAETPLIHGKNFGELLKRRIELMKGRENDEPYIDPDYMWRMSGPEWYRE